MYFDKDSFYEFILDILENKIIGVSNTPIKLKSGRESHFYINWRKIYEEAMNVDFLTDYVKYFYDSEFGDSTSVIFHGVPSGATPLGIIMQYKFSDGAFFTAEHEFLSRRSIELLVELIKNYANESEPLNIYGSPFDYSKYLALIAQYSQYDDSILWDEACLSYGREKVKDRGPAENRFFVQAPKGNILLVYIDGTDLDLVYEGISKVDGVNFIRKALINVSPDILLDKSYNPRDIVVIEDVTTTGGSLKKEIEKLRKEGFKVDKAIGITNRMELNEEGLSVEDSLRNIGVEYKCMSDALSLLPEVIERKGVSKDIVDKLKEEFRKYGVGELEY